MPALFPDTTPEADKGSRETLINLGKGSLS